MRVGRRRLVRGHQSRPHFGPERADGPGGAVRTVTWSGHMAISRGLPDPRVVHGFTLSESRVSGPQRRIPWTKSSNPFLSHRISDTQALR